MKFRLVASGTAYSFDSKTYSGSRFDVLNFLNNPSLSYLIPCSRSKTNPSWIFENSKRMVRFMDTGDIEIDYPRCTNQHNYERELNKYGYYS